MEHGGPGRGERDRTRTPNTSLETQKINPSRSRLKSTRAHDRNRSRTWTLIARSTSHMARIPHTTGLSCRTAQNVSSLPSPDPHAAPMLHQHLPQQRPPHTHHAAWLPLSSALAWRCARLAAFAPRLIVGGGASSGGGVGSLPFPRASERARAPASLPTPRACRR